MDPPPEHKLVPRVLKKPVQTKENPPEQHKRKNIMNEQPTNKMTRREHAAWQNMIGMLLIVIGAQLPGWWETIMWIGAFMYGYTIAKLTRPH